MNKKLMIHLYYGDPDEEFSLSLAETLVKNGADFLEIGIPYSDPVCDGEVFQRACRRSLEGGMTPFKVLTGVKKMRKKGLKQPIYITSYFGPIFKMGIKKFIKRVVAVGAQGVIIPDILLEEQEELLKCAKTYGISIVQFATPYSTDERLREIVAVTKGFIYCIAVPGVTGVRKKVEKQTVNLVKKVKRITKELKSDIPIYVGFGISKPVHAKTMFKAGADGVIMGSAVGKLYEKNIKKPKKSLIKIGRFIKEMSRVVN